jgi:hypothetical protein
MIQPVEMARYFPTNTSFSIDAEKPIRLSPQGREAVSLTEMVKWINQSDKGANDLVVDVD